MIITKRQLTDQEIQLLIDEIKKFPNLVAGNKKRWKNLHKVYVASLKNNLIGVCSVSEFGEWVKIGPFVVLEKYQGKGYGKRIIERIVNENKSKNLLTLSRNPAVWKIMKNFKFQEIKNPWSLPIVVKLFLFINTLQLLSLRNIQEQIKKRSLQKSPHLSFVKWVNKGN